MYTVNATKSALIKRFEENGWKELELTLKTGDRVWITPCYYGDGTPSVNDIEYYLMDSDSVYLCGSESVDKVAETLNNFSQLKDEDEQSKTELQKYFEDNIEGHSDEEWKLGSELNKLMWNNPNYSWQTPIREVAEGLAKELNGDADKFESALRLIECAETYSDWYKDVWGHRPRY